MTSTPQQTANNIKLEMEKILKMGVWACVPTHLHLVPEINYERAVKDTSILLVENIIMELEQEGRYNRLPHFIEVKEILQKL